MKKITPYIIVIVAIILTACDPMCIRLNCTQANIITDDLGGAIITNTTITAEVQPTGLASIDNTLYMVGQSHSVLYELNTTTEDIENTQWTQKNGEGGFNNEEHKPTGLASVGSALYMVGQSNNALYLFDTTQSAAEWERITGTGPETLPTGLTSIGNTLYMVGQSHATLYELDVTAEAPTWEQTTTIKGFGIDETQPTGLANINNELYLVGTQIDTIAKLNTETGIAEIIGNAFRFGKRETKPQDMASIGSTLYMIGQANNYLYRLNYNEDINMHFVHTCTLGDAKTGSTTEKGEIEQCKSCAPPRALQNNECVIKINPNFKVHENGITITCDEAALGETGVINGIEYTKRDNSEEYKLTTENAATSCISGTTDLSNLFSAEDAQNKRTFNEDLSHWDTSDVTTMRLTFARAETFNQEISNWDTGQVTTMEQMFYFAHAFDRNISGWNTENLEDASGMFTEASLFNRDLTEWCTPKMTSPDQWENFALDNPYFQGKNHPRWGGCNGFYPVITVDGDTTTIGPVIICDDADVGDKQIIKRINDDNNIEDVEYTKTVKGELTKENLALQTKTKKLCTSGITDMADIFKDQNDTNFFIQHWDTKNVTTMKDMFNGATMFNRDIGHWNTGNVTDMSGMFANTDRFNQNIVNWNTENVANMDAMFFDATAFNQDISGWDTSSITTHPTAFEGGTSALTAEHLPTFPSP